MRFNNQKGDFPLPILRPASYETNYVDSDFQFSLEVNQSSTPHSVSIDFEIVHPDIQRLIDLKSATVSLAIHCDSTYFYEVIDLANKKHQKITFDEHIVFGNVYFTLIVKAIKEIEKFCPSRLESGFDGLAAC